MAPILHIVCTLILFGFIEAGRILAVFPTPSISHQIVFRPLTQELAKRGHEVTVITTDPAFPNDGAPANLTEIDVHEISYTTWQKTFISAEKGNHNLKESLPTLLKSFDVVFEKQLQDKRVQELLSRKEHYDLILIEACVKLGYVFSHIYKAPMIAVSSLGAMPGDYRAIGAADHPLLYPSNLRDKIHNLTMLEKIIGLYQHYTITSIYESRERVENEILRKYFGPNVPTINELENNIDLLLLNIHPIFEGIRPVPPNVVYMGGIHQKPEKPLPRDLNNYLNSSKNGVVYFSLGTNVDTNFIPMDKKRVIFNTLSKLPYDVLMRWGKNEVPEHSDNIRIVQWIPQSDVLRHSKIKLFINQGGLQSTDEAIAAGVPLVSIPMLGDQWFNSDKYEYLKIGRKLDFRTLNEEDFMHAIRTVVENDSYRHNIVKLGELMNDQPQRPLERAVWWMEHVLRHGGAKHLRSPAANMPWTQYLELKLVFTVLAALLALLLVVSLVLYKLYKIMKSTEIVKMKKT